MACPVRAISTRTRPDRCRICGTSFPSWWFQAGVLAGSLARRAGDPGLCAQLAGRGAGTYSRSAGRTGGVSGRSRVRPRKTAKLFDPGFGRDFSKWRAVWDQTGIFSSEIARTRQNIRDFYYFKKRDPATGARSKGHSGDFMKHTGSARLDTEERGGPSQSKPKA